MMHDITKYDGTTRRGFLKTGLGAAATAVAFPMMAGRASAHFPKKLAIDIEPDCDENTLDPDCHGVVPVAVLYTEFENDKRETVVFDPTERAMRYRFGAPDVVQSDGAKPVHDGHVEDVNGDGHDDLVLHFPIEETGFDGDESVGTLVWEREEGGHGYSGTDQVTIVGQSDASESYGLVGSIRQWYGFAWD
jgi:hypothetical protein